MKYLLLVFNIFSVLMGNSQELIKVLDRKTGLPISYVTVKVLNSDRGIIASGEGLFSLEIKQKDSVLFTCAGYEDTICEGKDVGRIVYLNQKVIELKSVVISNKMAKSTIIIGNEAKISKGDITWGPYPFKYVASEYHGEFAQKIVIPDSIRLLKVKKIFVPVKKLGKCFGTLLLKMYYPDTLNHYPGTAILNRLISVDSDLLIKKRILSVDISKNEFLFAGCDSFFISITWPPEVFNDECKTGLPLSKKATSQTFSRSLTVNSFQWYPFGRMKDEKGIEYIIKTFFSIEAEIYK
ncbi:MAG TPA: hypothetical protein PKA77_13495 [Chitinophagaceae bacterium]|jgi:hypothetical protein|nr:hypothetical protein [Chitinophagaceae bacterium]HMU60015.1 hypothetical protein [Chitinophagaceae bacterium]